jgi:hypothetical protein
MPSHPPQRRAVQLAAGLGMSLGMSLGLGLIPGLAIGPARAEPAPDTTVVWHCYRNAAATVLATEKTESVGSRYLLRKTTADLKADCAVEQRPTDRVLGEDDPTNAKGWSAYNTIGLVQGLLILDEGTSPDRSLVIVEVPAGRKILDVGYSVQEGCSPSSGCQSEEFRFDDKELTFWRQLKEKPTPKNCQGYAGFMKTTGSAALEERSVFTFATRKVAGSGTKRCTVRQ